MSVIKVRLNDSGIPLGFYDQNYPEGSIEITSEQHEKLLQGYPFVAFINGQIIDLPKIELEKTPLAESEE